MWQSQRSSGFVIYGSRKNYVVLFATWFEIAVHKELSFASLLKPRNLLRHNFCCFATVALVRIYY